jgi:hypothetical protein
MPDDLLDLNGILALPELTWSIEELLPQGGLLIFGGSPKDGKSVIALDLVIKGVQGRLAFGRYPMHFERALIFNAEGRHQGIRMRDMMFRDLNAEVRSRIFVSGKPIKLSLPTGQPNIMAFKDLERTIKDKGIQLAVLDPLISFHAGDENNSQQMVALLDELRSVGESTKCSFLIVHHTRKPSSQQTLEMAIDQGPAMLRGAGGIFGAVDCALMVWRIGLKRLITFSTRYARESTDEVEMQMDKRSWRMYPITNGLPDPKEWAMDWGTDDASWEKYKLGFGLNVDQTALARKQA